MNQPNAIADNADTDIVAYMRAVGEQARSASAVAATASTGQKNNALKAAARVIESSRAELMEANKLDLKGGEEKQLASALMDRLELTPARIDTMLEGLEQVASLADPIGEITDMGYRPSGIQVGKMRVPLGVMGMIYESRPNVTVEAASLSIKSGNACILRGGSEALHSNTAIAACIAEGLAEANLPHALVQLVATRDRAAVGELLRMNDCVDVIVPRGGKSLIERITAEATVPVIKHLDGICHVYIDVDADRQKAIDVAVNSKTQRYGTCNTMETLLVSSAVPELLVEVVEAIHAKGVEIRACKRSLSLLPASMSAAAATEDDWFEEYLAPVLAVRMVDGLDEAIRHINHYGSQHTDSIVSENHSSAQRFLRAVDSSSVMINASTRFADGFEYGLGAEIGISTDKIHARGPVGLEGLTSQKYIVLGDGHIRQ